MDAYWDDRGLYRDGDGQRVGGVLYDVAPGREPTGTDDYCAIFGHRSIGRHPTRAAARAQVEQAHRDWTAAQEATNRR
jgi:hypothetical protein